MPYIDQDPRWDSDRAQRDSLWAKEDCRGYAGMFFAAIAIIGGLAFVGWMTFKIDPGTTTTNQPHDKFMTDLVNKPITPPEFVGEIPKIGKVYRVQIINITRTGRDVLYYTDTGVQLTTIPQQRPPLINNPYGNAQY